MRMGAVRGLGCPAELGASLGGGASLRLKQPPALPGRSPPGAAFHLSVNFCTKNKTKPKSVSCSTTRSAAKPFWGHGQPGPLPTAAPSAGRAAAGGRDWGDAPRRAASAPPSLPPPASHLSAPRVGALLTHLPTPPLPTPPRRALRGAALQTRLRQQTKATPHRGGTKRSSDPQPPAGTALVGGGTGCGFLG